MSEKSGEHDHRHSCHAELLCRHQPAVTGYDLAPLISDDGACHAAILGDAAGELIELLCRMRARIARRGPQACRRQIDDLETMCATRPGVGSFGGEAVAGLGSPCTSIVGRRHRSLGHLCRDRPASFNYGHVTTSPQRYRVIRGCWASSPRRAVLPFTRNLSNVEPDERPSPWFSGPQYSPPSPTHFAATRTARDKNPWSARKIHCCAI